MYDQTFFNRSESFKMKNVSKFKKREQHFDSGYFLMIYVMIPEFEKNANLKSVKVL